MESPVKNELKVFFELIPEKKGWWFWKTNFALKMQSPYDEEEKVVIGRFKTLEDAIEYFKQYRGQG